MFLTSYNLADYLTASGLLSRRALVDGDFTVIEAGRRNRNFKVPRRQNSGLFVKQIKTPTAEAAATLRREAIFYRAVAANPAYAGLQALTPRLVHYDERRQALLVELLSNAETLAERSVYDGSFDTATAARLGRTLATVHAFGQALVNDVAVRAAFAYQPPWPITLDQTGYGFLDSLGPIGPALSAALRSQPTFAARLSALRRAWQFDSLINGDMKWDNCVLVAGVDGATDSTLVIVDWEMVDIGDGAWDVAGILKEYVVALITPPPRGLDALAPAASAFWQAYVEGRRLTPPTAVAYFERAIALTAARLVIAVLEYLPTATNLGDLGQRLLQASAQILEWPQVVAAQLLGRPVGS